MDGVVLGGHMHGAGEQADRLTFPRGQDSIADIYGLGWRPKKLDRLCWRPTIAPEASFAARSHQS